MVKLWLVWLVLGEVGCVVGISLSVAMVKPTRSDGFESGLKYFAGSDVGSSLFGFGLDLKRGISGFLALPSGRSTPSSVLG
ncbi:hypothetical protein Bca52824_084870 [Brassica carinata]|uniref:Uncharacterized protein n=1 Tax=Brassica carinata TaxID=52824 RepID=A0A8X7PLR4_BRACI|nr:hypothetical protein Bca52824_084870 [Brassica carinata]